MGKNPNVDQLYGTYSNLTERFYDRIQRLMFEARSGDLGAAEVGDAAVEALYDGVEAIAAPWLLMLDATLTFSSGGPVVRMRVGPDKANRNKNTGIRLDSAVTPAPQTLVNVDDSTKTIGTSKVDANVNAKGRLIVKLKNLTTLTVPGGVYEGNIVDTAASNAPIVKLIVHWPG